MNADDELVPRTSLLDEFRISDSAERRLRKEGTDWPPHLLIGRKVYYRRETVAGWLRNRESALRQPGSHHAADTEQLTGVLRSAKILAESAPPLTAEQAQLLRHLTVAKAGVTTK
jgi:hypothetical protein